MLWTEKVECCLLQGYFKERIVPKTFEKALKKAKNVDLLFNHDKNRNLGSIENGNLELYEDNIGLRAIATVTDEQVIKRPRIKNYVVGHLVLFLKKIHGKKVNLVFKNALLKN